MKYGLMTPMRYQELKAQGIELRVMLDGQDVTSHCVMADDEKGFVVHNKLRNGNTYLEDGHVARYTRKGNVEFVRVDGPKD